MHLLYSRLGYRYPKAILAAQFQIALVVVFGALLLFRLYQPMSDRHFWLIAAVSETLVLIENLWGLRVCFSLLEPAQRWIRGQRDPQTTSAAWRAAATLPRQYVRQHGKTPVLFTVFPIAVFIVVILDLRPIELALPACLAAALVTLLYGAALRFFAMEVAMTPVVEDIAVNLPEGFDHGKDGVSLRWKLLLGLPLINIVTGVVVEGLSPHPPGSTVAGIGIAMLVAVGVAFTVSLELTMLLARSVLTPLENLRRAAARIGEGDLSVRVPVITADETGRLTQAFNYAVAGLEERERLHQAFGAYVDPEVAERVLREGSELAGDDVEVSVLFLDIREFTAFAERSSAREVVEQLNQVFELAVPVLIRNGGHANKFIGDGLMGVFGAPDRRSDHADRAVAAGRELVGEMERAFGDRLRIGVGVNSGPVVAGTIGGGGRIEFTVIGDAVNTAARVEAMTRETGDAMLITEATRCLLSDPEAIEWIERPAAPLKGKSETVRVWAPAQHALVPAGGLATSRGASA
ncbi:MAG: adenylate/guanylate cyclase domain-containing protein [Solirubrobacteraceae bacterium]